MFGLNPVSRMERQMLRILISALACLVVFPSMQAMADDSANSEAATTASSETTPSGTTTYFGKKAATERSAEAEKPKEAVKPRPLPAPTLTASINLATQKMVVSVKGEARYSWPISSGVAQFPTPTGTFRPQWTAKMWYSRKYDMSPMPHAVFINGGVAVHGTYYVSSLGRAASHGCIRLSTANAKTFYNLVQKHGLQATKVTVFGRPHWRGPAAAVATRETTREPAYAENNSFWGDFWGNSSDSAYAPNFTKKKYRNGYSYYDSNGVQRKVHRRKDGTYVVEQRPPSRTYYKKYGYGYAQGY
jgi:lipoprotein-anchoring transpeptidase ErfK/SrfK